MTFARPGASDIRHGWIVRRVEWVSQESGVRRGEVMSTNNLMSNLVELF